MGADVHGELEVAERRVARLLRRCARDDVGAMSELLRMTAIGMLTTARSVTASESEATDAVVDAYVEVWERARRHEDFGRSPVRTMLAIAHRVARDASRPRLSLVPEGCA